jgi:enoyl-CoA hydratase
VGIVTVTHGADGVAVIAADHPPANAMNVEWLGELVEAINGVSADVPAAVVLTGREGFFSAGADLKAVPGYGPPEQRRMVEGINAMALGVYSLPCPVVGAITGHAIAGGMVLALCTDMRIASTAGKYGRRRSRSASPIPRLRSASSRPSSPRTRPAG